MKTRTLLLKNILSLAAVALFTGLSFAQEAIKVAHKQSNVACFGETNGSIELSISGGTAPYTVYWSNGMTGERIENLGFGVITAYITDTKDNTATKTVVIQGPEQPISISGTVTHVTAAGGTDGAIELNVAGGTPDETNPLHYQINWNNGDSEMAARMLKAGVYTVEITDKNLCKATQSFTISEPEREERNKLFGTKVQLVVEEVGSGNYVIITNAADNSIQELVLIDLDKGSVESLEPFNGVIRLDNVTTGRYFISVLTTDGKRISQIFQVI